MSECLDLEELLVVVVQEFLLHLCKQLFFSTVALDAETFGIKSPEEKKVSFV